METDLEKLRSEALAAFKEAGTADALEEAFRQYLGRKGILTQVLRSLGNLDAKQRSRIGKQANELRDTLQLTYEERKRELQGQAARRAEQQESIDITAPGVKLQRGHLHPLTHLQRQVIEIFRAMGFGVAEGPEAESEWYNFDALNIPANHPARDMWDTFWLKPRKDNLLLRTHTSPVQVRFMETHNPPFRIIAPGRVFRYEATDARHGFQLYQLEGLVVGKDASVANFRALIQEFYRQLFRRDMNIRLRPSYFPFVEPGFEVDMTCVICSGKGCSSCGGGGWLEMMGAGMVHPNVFKAAGYVPGEWQGFAFGMGLDRLAMMKYGIPDIRLFYSGDMQFLRQF